jgi:hypothetical protein
MLQEQYCAINNMRAEEVCVCRNLRGASMMKAAGYVVSISPPA